LFPNGSFPNGLWPNGGTIENVTFDGSLIKGVVSGKAISGADFIGATFPVLMPGTTDTVLVTIRIDDASKDVTYPDLWWYRMSYKTMKDTSFSSLCLDSTGAPDVLVPLNGMYWDAATLSRVDSPNVVTLSCREGVLGKCAHIGYRPWGTGTSCNASDKSQCMQVSLRDYHQACTRMLRADYCGNGSPHTLNGTIIDVFDYLQPPIQLREETWDMESRWLPTGAMCLSKPRHPELWPGGCPNTNAASGETNLVKLPKCSAFEDHRGLIVSTHDSGSTTATK
jgi:hypothetical protein